MSDLHETVITSPILFFQDKTKRRQAVSYRGHLMFPSVAYRLKELRPVVQKMNDDGMTLRKAAKRLGYTRQTFRKYLRIWGMRWKRADKARPIDKTGWKEAIIKAASQGWTLQRTGEALDTDLVNVHRFCKRHGIEWKKLRKQDSPPTT